MAKTATYSLIQSQTIGSNVASITLSSIPQTFTDLVLVANIQSTATLYNGENIKIGFNGNTSSTLSVTRLQGDGSNAGSGRYTGNTTSVISARAINQTSGNGTSIFTPNIFHFMDYSNTTTYKTWLTRFNEITPSSGYFGAFVGLFQSTSAISSITIYDGLDSSPALLATGSTFRLYGIEAYK
jgi:hypothetical protein